MKKMKTFAFLSMILLSHQSLPCTRILYQGKDNQVMTARSMDWAEDVLTNLWIFPRGVKRSGEAGKNSINWTSKYGSIIASGYEVSTTDGMNEKGLVTNLLWLVESSYPKVTKNSPTLAISLWAQFILDNFATVDEAIKHLKKEPYQIVTSTVPGQDRLATLHLAISDAQGDSAIIEYIDGKQVIHHSSKYLVMTNSPTFEKQLSLYEYWKEIGGTTMLPGTNRSADRFARASFYINAIPKSQDHRENVASVFSVIRNVSVPYGISTPNQPNISSTRWRTVSDHKELTYYFESALTPNTFWINLKEVDFTEKTGKILRLDLGDNQKNIYSGNSIKSFKESKPFQFLSVK